MGSRRWCPPIRTTSSLLTLFERGVLGLIGLGLLLVALFGLAVRYRDLGLLAVVLAVLIANLFDATLLSGACAVPPRGAGGVAQRPRGARGAAPKAPPDGPRASWPVPTWGPPTRAAAGAVSRCASHWACRSSFTRRCCTRS